MSIFALAVTLFLVANPIGNSPTILALIKNFDFEKQKKILFREAMFALLIVLFSQFFGELFLGLLNVHEYSLMIMGGVILFILALHMLFHKPESSKDAQAKREPFIVPIAIPLISGPGIITVVMVNARAEMNDLKVTGAILLAWIGVTGVLMLAPYLQKIIGTRGMAATEQVMGLVLGLISMQMLVNGSMLFVKSL